MDEVDEWFMTSIKRYDKLYMFSICSPVYEQELKSENELYVAFNEGNINQITVITLPEKLMRENKSKFTTPVLGFNGHSILAPCLVQLKSIYNNSKFIISEHTGVSLYGCKTFDSDTDDSIIKITDIPYDVPQARLAIDVSRNYLALSGKSNEKKLLVDYECTKPITEFSHSDVADGILTPLFLSSDLLSFANNSMGYVELHDLRMSGSTAIISICDGANVEAACFLGPAWNFYTTYEDNLNHNKPLNCTDKYIYSMSNEGHFRLYDIRNSSKPLCSDKHPDFPTTSNSNGQSRNVRVKANPSNYNQFCVSGLDENLYIFDIDNSAIRMMFKHDGHRYDDNYNDKDNILTASFCWLPHVSSNTIISSCSNLSLQCWQFIA